MILFVIQIHQKVLQMQLYIDLNKDDLNYQ